MLLNYYTLEVPTTCSLSFIYLLGCLTELGKNIAYEITSLKSYDSGIARWKERCIGQGMGKECGVPMPLAGCILLELMCSHKWSSFEPTLLFLTEASFHRPGVVRTDHW